MRFCAGEGLSIDDSVSKVRAHVSSPSVHVHVGWVGEAYLQIHDHYVVTRTSNDGIWINAYSSHK